MSERRAAINDAIARILLRYFRTAKKALIGTPLVDAAADNEFLLAHWAMSSSMLEFWRYVRQRAHELESILTSSPAEGASGIRGRLDAVRTVIRRRVTGNSALFAYNEPTRSYDSGANQLVAWILARGSLTIAPLLAAEDGAYSEMSQNALKLIRDAMRLEAIRGVTQTRSLQTSWPSSLAIRQAGRSRKEIYRKAYAAYCVLNAIQDGNAAAIGEVLRETLIAPLNDWQSFELMTALTIASTLQAELQTPMQIANVTFAMDAPLIRVGPYAILWQRHGPDYQPPRLERYEETVADILTAYGTPYASDRPDIVIVDRETLKTVAIIEVKYFQSESSSRDAFREAVQQLVRYARGYRARPVHEMLDTSLVAMTSNEDIQPVATLPVGTPSLVDFDDLLAGRLRPWVAKVVAGRAAPPSAASGSAS